MLASDIAFGLISTGRLAAVCLALDCLQQAALANGQLDSLASVETLTLLEQQPPVSLVVFWAVLASPACTAIAKDITIAERIIRFIS